MEYRILNCKGSILSMALSRLEKKVEELLKYGWEPQGGVTVHSGGVDTYYEVCQAMIKR